MTTKNNRATLRRITATAGIAGLTILGSAGAVSAQSYPSGGQATFSDASPTAGQTVAVSGNAVAGTQVSITLALPDGTILVLGTTVASASGTFALNVTLPADLADGEYVLAAFNDTQVLSSSLFSLGGSVTQGSNEPAQTGAGGSGDVAAAQTPTQLPVTGGESALLLWGGAGFVVIGGAALVASKLRSEPLVS